METEDGLNRRPQSGAIAIAVYCAFQSSHLVAAWRHSPFDRWSWIALLIWLAPLGAVWTRTPAEFRLGRLNHWLLGLALLVSLLGTVTSMNAIKFSNGDGSGLARPGQRREPIVDDGSTHLATLFARSHHSPTIGKNRGISR